MGLQESLCLGRERIARALEVGRQAAQEGSSPAQAISLLERAGTIQALPVSTARGSIDLMRAATHSPIKDVTKACSVHPQSAHAGLLASSQVTCTALRCWMGAPAMIPM